VPPTRRSTAVLPLSAPIFLILLSLADGDAHGSRIRASVLERSNGSVKLDPGSLYRLIARLCDDGLIAETPGRPSGEPDDERRRYYQLTPIGRRLLKAETERLAGLVSAARAATSKRARSAQG
jgi:DNA-binding PadR family transcriptional regulator